MSSDAIEEESSNAGYVAVDGVVEELQSFGRQRRVDATCIIRGCVPLEETVTFEGLDQPSDAASGVDEVIGEFGHPQPPFGCGCQLVENLEARDTDTESPLQICIEAGDDAWRGDDEHSPDFAVANAETLSE